MGEGAAAIAQGAAAIAQASNPLLLRRSTIIFLGMFVIGVVCASKDERPPPPTSTATREAASRICLSNQSSALLQFKHSLLSIKYLQPGMLSSWQHNGSDCCHWEGVTCNNLTGFVIALEIPDFAELPYDTLTDDYRSLRRHIPIDASLFKLRYLQRLDLSYNLLNGSIPKRFGELTHLTHLNLSHCDFSGQIPVELSQMTQLVSLDLSDNPGLLLQHPNFSQIFRGFVHLEHLRLDGVNVSLSLRDVSMTLSSSHELQTFCLSRCNISGPVEETSILEGLCSLGNITSLRLRANFMTGAIPPCLFSLHSLKDLDLGGNNFNSQIPNLQLYPIPSSLQIAELDLSGNLLTGSIPSSLFNLSFLATLDLSDNLLTGKIPKSLFNCSSLRVLDLGDNKLNDSFPSQLGQLGMLQALILKSNHLHGPITVDASHQEFHSLKIFDISSNYFSGFLPLELFQSFKAMMSGTPENESEILQINSAFLIDLSSNNFTGRIPEEIGSLTSLNILNFSSNHLVGSIPESFDKLQQMESLDLSHNQLSGVIPGKLSELKFLAILDVSYNDLHGMIPQEGMFGILPASSFEGNPKLCGLQVNRSCSHVVGDGSHAGGDGLVEEENKHIKEKGWKYGSVGFGFIVGLVITTLPFLFMNRVADWYWDGTDRMIDFILQGVFPSRFGRRRD